MPTNPPLTAAELDALEARVRESILIAWETAVRIKNGEGVSFADIKPIFDDSMKIVMDDVPSLFAAVREARALVEALVRDADPEPVSVPTFAAPVICELVRKSTVDAARAAKARWSGAGEEGE